MSSLDRPVRRAIYLAVLAASEPSPLLPETGEEPRAEPKEEARPKPAGGPVAVRIDIAGIGQRILALKVPAGDYTDLRAGAAGVIFYEEPMVPGAGAAA